MKGTIGNLPTSYHVSMSYEEQIEEIRSKTQEILNDNNIIIENYNKIIEQYNIINQKYDDIIVDYEEILGEYQDLLQRINTNTSSIGTLNNLSTTEKNNLVDAINEVDSNCDNNSSAISLLQEDVNNLKEDEYSTNEAKTNKIWTDGKPIYRKIYNTSITTHDIISVPSFFNNIDTLINFSGTAKNQNFSYPFYYKSESDSFLAIRNGGSTLEIQPGSIYPAVPFNAVIVIEYTKTTD